VSTRGRHRTSGRRRRWEALSDEALLDWRLCDLGLRCRGSRLEPSLEQLDRELEAAGLRFRPHAWLSTDWFSPSGVPGFGIPFYLAHTRLIRLERRQMFEVEGASPQDCMRLMRHETGHAIDWAYRLHHRKAWREVFGPASRPYTASYVPRRRSRSYVHNLENWYAQSHPIEDFAETFAVWLRPRSTWRKSYAGWKRALRKLEFVDALMAEIADAPPPGRARGRAGGHARFRQTLRQYYRQKQGHYGFADRSVYDRDLRRLFGEDAAHRRRKRAAAFLRERRGELRRRVARWTGQHQFAIDRVLGEMILRCRELGLHLAHPERETGEGAAVLVTVHSVRLERSRHLEYFR
jgi:hypothetical protein